MARRSYRKEALMLRLICRARELRLLLWLGVAVFVAGVGLDLAVHFLLPPSPLPLPHPHAPAENLAHTITFAGMALLLAGVLAAPRPRLVSVPAGEQPGEGR
jgi:hypothetical protein